MLIAESEEQESGRTGPEVTEDPEPDRPGLEEQRSLEVVGEEEEHNPSDMAGLQLVLQEAGRITGLSVSSSCSQLPVAEESIAMVLMVALAEPAVEE